MAHKATSFKVDDKKKVIILYSNVEAPAGEKALIEFYLTKGYTPMFEEKKEGISVDEMRAELEKADKDALKKFDKIYAIKATDQMTKAEKKEIGFFGACKFYNQWKKEQKQAKKQEQTTEEQQEQTTEE